MFFMSCILPFLTHGKLSRVTCQKNHKLEFFDISTHMLSWVNYNVHAIYLFIYLHPNLEARPLYFGNTNFPLYCFISTSLLTPPMYIYKHKMRCSFFVQSHDRWWPTLWNLFLTSLEVPTFMVGTYFSFSYNLLQAFSSLEIIELDSG